jgi:hypothetical protein
MKIRKSGFIALIAVMTVLGGAAFAAPSSNDNWQVIKRAVQEDPHPAAVRGEAKWFKILITDRKEKGGEVRITLPLSLIEGLAELVSDEPIRCNGRELNLNFADILEELKKAGPLALIEIGDDDGTIKVWIE